MRLLDEASRWMEHQMEYDEAVGLPGELEEYRAERLADLLLWLLPLPDDGQGR